MLNSKQFSLTKEGSTDGGRLEVKHKLRMMPGSSLEGLHHLAPLPWRFDAPLLTIHGRLFQCIFLVSKDNFIAARNLSLPPGYFWQRASLILFPGRQ
jgi:hypothetical protein